MRCDQFERFLHAWIDETLVPEEAMETRAHADACPMCAELAGALRDALAACRDMGGEAEVPQAAAMSWRRAVRTEAANTKERRGLFPGPRWQAWAGLAAGILVLIGGANLVRLGRMSLQPAALYESADVAAPVSETYEAPALYLGAAGGTLDLAEAEPDEEFKEEEALRETRKAVEITVKPDGNADAPAARAAPLAFLLDACIFLALCLPPAAIAFGVVRLRKREKKAPNQPEE